MNNTYQTPTEKVTTTTEAINHCLGRLLASAKLHDATPGMRYCQGDVERTNAEVEQIKALADQLAKSLDPYGHMS